MTNPDRLDSIKINLRSSKVIERKSALDELAEFPADVAIPILEKLATEKDFALRCLAMMGFGNHPTEASFQMLKNILENETDSSVVAEAANSLFEFGDRSIALLLELFERSDHWLVRQTVISILVETNDPSILLNIAKKAIQDPIQTTKETGILAINRLLQTPLKQEALDLLAQLSEDSDWRTRWRTAIVLAASQEPQAKQLLVKLRQDENYRVVAAALEKVGD